MLLSFKLIIQLLMNVYQQINELKSQFILDLLNDRYGARCVVLSIGKMRVTVLDNDEVNIPTVLSQIAEHFQELTDKKN